MRKFLILAAVTAFLGLATAAPAFAQATGGGPGAGATTPGRTFWVIPDGNAGIAVGAAIGTGIIVLGAAAGIGRIGAAAAEATARQPEAGGQIFTSMLLSAALIEGFTLFGVVVTLLIALNMV